MLFRSFANQSRALGMGIRQAAINAAKQRFRPILMTAISSLVGFSPLLFASSVGAISRWSLGTAIFGGLTLATVMSLLLVPNLYIAIKNFEEYVLKGGKPPKPPRLPTTKKGKPTPQSPTPETEETPVLQTSTETD